MAISIGDALLKLGVDTRDLDKGMQKVGNTIKKHHKAIGIAATAMGGAILAAGVLSVKTFAQMGDEVQKMALRTGFSTEALSELRHAAEISGANLGTLEKAVKRMSGTILDAQDGLETYIRAFQHIGIEIEELEGLNPEQQFLKIAEAIAELEDPTKRAAIAQDIFGRAGTELLPLFAAGKSGLKDLREEAHKLGIVFDQEAANKAAEFNDAMTRMNESVSGVKMVIASQLIPILLPLIDKIKDIISGISAWLKEHPELARVITLTTGAIGGLLLILGPLLIFLPQITAAYTIMRGFMVTRLIPSIVAATSALWAKVAALYATLAAMGPVGWAIAGISAALAATIPFLMKTTRETKELTGAMSDLERQTVRMNVQQKFTAEAWDAIAEKGYLTEQEFRQLAEAMGLTTEALYDQLAAAGMLERVWTSEAGRIYIRNLEDMKIGLEEVADASERTADEMIRDIEDLTREAKDAARERTRAEISALDDRMAAERDAYQERMDALRDEYNATIKIIDAELSAELRVYQDEIDLINQELRKEEDARRDRQYAEQKAELEARIANEKDADKRIALERRLNELILESGNETWQTERKLALEAKIAEAKDAEERAALEQQLSAQLIALEIERRNEERRLALEAQIANATDAEEKMRLEEELAEFLKQSQISQAEAEAAFREEARIAEAEAAEERKALEEELAYYLTELQAEQTKTELELRREALEEKMDMAREEAQNAKDRAQEEYDYKRDLEETAFDDLITRLEEEKELLDIALEEKLKRFDDDLAAYKAMCAGEVEATASLVEAINELLAQLEDKTITITTVHRDVYEEAAPPKPKPPEEEEYPPMTPAEEEKWEKLRPEEEEYPPMTPAEEEKWEKLRPSLQGGAIAMRPILARIAEKRPEAVIPLDRETLERLGLGGGGFKTADIRIYLNGRVIAQETEQPLVDEIRLRTGVRI